MDAPTWLLAVALVGLFAVPARADGPDRLIGHPAPAFEATSDRGATVRLQDFAGQQAVLLAFFPKAFTPG